jgi:hypothetical protein
VSGQVRQGVSIFFGCPDSLGRKFRFSWVSGQVRRFSVRTGRLGVREAGSVGFLGCPDIPLTCPDTARVKTAGTRFQLIFSAPFPFPRDFLPSLT